MRDIYVPQYLIQEDEEQEKPEEKGKQKLYSPCIKCGHYIRKDNAESHRKLWCDPNKVRRKYIAVKEKLTELAGGYALGYGVVPRPIENPPTQILRGRCRDCGAQLALPDDFRCMACDVLEVKS